MFATLPPTPLSVRPGRYIKTINNQNAIAYLRENKRTMPIHLKHRVQAIHCIPLLTQSGFQCSLGLMFPSSWLCQSTPLAHIIKEPNFPSKKKCFTLIKENGGRGL